MTHIQLQYVYYRKFFHTISTQSLTIIFSAVHHGEMVQKNGKNKKKTKGYMVT